MEKSLSQQFRSALGRKRKNIVFACIGTDRSTGDSLGPLVGTYLERMGYGVIGTIDDPLHAENLEERVGKISKKSTVVAVDASLGSSANVGEIKVRKGPISPGAGVGKDLIKVGHMHVVGIVNVGGFMEFFVLQNTRLSLVMRMANEIVSAITEVLPTPSMSEAAATEQGKG